MHNIQIQIDFLTCFVTLVVGFVGFLIGKKEWKKTNDYNKGKNVYDLLSKLRDEKEILNIFELADLEKLVYYDEENAIINKDNNVDVTDQVDRTLSYYNYVCYLYDAKIFDKREKKFFTYEFQCLATNEEIIRYLKRLRDVYMNYECKSIKKDATPFEFLTSFLEKNEMI